MTWIPFGLILAGLALAGPAGPVGVTVAPSARPGATSPSNRGAGSIESSRQSLLTDVETLGGLIEDAKKDKDMPRLNCLVEVKVDADKTTELATAEYLRARNPNADAFERVLAKEKLSAAAFTMGELLKQGRACSFQSSDEDPTMTRNDSKEDTVIAINDPTSVPVVSPGMPPILDPSWLPTASGLQ